MKKMVKFCGIVSLLFYLVLFLPTKVIMHATFSGSITVELKKLEDDANSKIQNIGFHLYRVGFIDQYANPQIDEKYGIKEYPQKAEDAETTCTRILEKLTDKEIMNQKSDESGHLTFTQLDKGVYLLVADKNNNYGKIQPSLLHLPYFTEVDGEKQGPFYQIKVLPKATGNDYIIVPDKEPNNNGQTNETDSSQEHNPNDKEDTKTGDTTNKNAYLILIVIAGATMIILREKGKRETNHEHKQ